MKFIQAVLILSGMIIGVGMFGIPFSFARAGFLLGTIELAILTAAILALHLLYGEIVLATPSSHQLPGYVKIYLGKRVALLGWTSAIFGMALTLLAYIVVGSIFLKNILVWFGQEIPGSWAALALVFAGALITALPLKKETLINGVLTGMLVLFIIALTVFLLPHVRPESLAGFSVKDSFLPYGVLLFALSGGAVIPELVFFLDRKRGSTRAAIAVGTLIPALLYFLFALAVVGTTGSSTSEEAIRGLGTVVGGNVSFLGSIIGLLAVFTSFTALSTSFQEVLAFDLGLSNILSWAASILFPPLIYFSGFHNFISIVGVVGAVAVGIDSALIIATQHRVGERGGRTLSLRSHLWRIGVYAMIAVGVVYHLFNIFKG